MVKIVIFNRNTCAVWLRLLVESMQCRLNSSLAFCMNCLYCATACHRPKSVTRMRKLRQFLLYRAAGWMYNDNQRGRWGWSKRDGESGVKLVQVCITVQPSKMYKCNTLELFRLQLNFAAWTTNLLSELSKRALLQIAPLAGAPDLAFKGQVEMRVFLHYNP